MNIPSAVLSMMNKLVVQAWNDGYQTALANCETAIYQGEGALHDLLKGVKDDAAS